jgi:hypothetical protein
VVNRLLGWGLLAALIAGLVWLAVAWWPSPEKAIRKTLARGAELASITGKEGDLARLANAKELAGLFTQDAVVRVDIEGGPRGQLSGRDQIFQAAMGMRTVVGALNVQLLDVVVRLTPDKLSAVVEATGKAAQPGVRDVFWQELRFHFVNEDGDWKIDRVETVRTLTWIDRPLKDSSRVAADVSPLKLAVDEAMLVGAGSRRLPLFERTADATPASRALDRHFA